MREIKFRIWKDREMIFLSSALSNGDVFLMNGNSLMPDTDKIEIMQYTGLKDKNGKEIYEGDILELIDWYDDSISIHPVVFKNSAFMCQRLDDKEFPFFYLQGNDDLKDGYKVIGNIYENPELLEGAK